MVGSDIESWNPRLDIEDEQSGSAAMVKSSFAKGEQEGQ